MEMILDVFATSLLNSWRLDALITNVEIWVFLSYLLTEQIYCQIFQPNLKVWTKVHVLIWWILKPIIVQQRNWNGCKWWILSWLLQQVGEQTFKFVPAPDYLPPHYLNPLLGCVACTVHTVTILFKDIVSK